MPHDAAILSYLPIASLQPFPGNPRRHSPKQIRQVAASIRRFGFKVPVLISDDDVILAGHCRVEAARSLGWDSVPCVRAGSMTEAEKKAFIVADNQLATLSTFDSELLSIVFSELTVASEIDVTVTGFSQGEVEAIIEVGGNRFDSETRDDAVVPSSNRTDPVTRSGDIWSLGDHRLICGDARDTDVYLALMQTEGIAETAELVISDPPFNVRIDGHVGGLGKIKHREFAMASGEMSTAEFKKFLRAVLCQIAAVSRDGSLHFIFMDWRHGRDLQDVGEEVFGELKNLIVWVKDQGGMGSFYRSQHELIYVFKLGNAAHINTFELGQHGRTRTNVWTYRGVNSGGKQAREELAMHPTVKPVAMIADAMRDCSRRGGIVLDAFAGSGTILIAAQKVGRKARAIEIDPIYCDTAVRRWQAYAKDDAVLTATGETFSEVERRRQSENAVAREAILDTPSLSEPPRKEAKTRSPWSRPPEPLAGENRP